jgi:TonB dependent receptor/TonB-dependent Receptor Plug Domain
MDIAPEEHYSSAIGLRHDASGVHCLARLCLHGLVLGASVFVLRAEPTPAPADPGAPREAAASSREEPVVRLDKVVVTPSQYGIAEERIAPNVTLTSTELETLPQLGEDLYRTITRLPGLTGNDFSAKFLVRGAPNSQLLARYDGVDLIEPFHLKDWDGSLSIVDLQTIGSVDLVTGGFTTEYGDRLAGVLTMETQEFARPKALTTLGLSVTDIRATNQGEFAGGDGQWMVAARRGYIDLAVKLGGGEIDASPIYYDFSSKVEYRLNPHHTLSLHVLYANDTYQRLQNGRWDDDPDLRSSYDSAYLWGRWRGDFGERLSGEGVLSLSQLDWHRHGNGLLDGGIHRFTLRDDRRLDTAGLRQDWTLKLTERALLRTGFELKSGEARYDYDLLRDLWSLSNGNLLTTTRTVDYRLRPDGDYAAAYLAPRLQLGSPLVIEPGVRFERHSYTNDSGWSPRLNASLALGPHTTVRAAWGIYEQAQGLQELSMQDRETTFSRSERAEQRVLGVSHQLASGLALRLEAYERLSSRLRPYWENPIDPGNVFPEALYDRTKISPSRGRARGIELLAENRRNPRFGWSASYTYAVAEEDVGGFWIPRMWDQRHTFYADVTYVPAAHWQLSASWQYHTGWPFTDINYYLTTLNDGSLIYSWTYGPLGGLRAPAYHRLDLRATRTYRLKRGTLRAFVDIFNAYDRKNEVGFGSHYAWIAQGQLHVVKTPGTMLPLLPSFGLSWEF